MTASGDTVGRLVWGLLRDAGIEYAFAVPGESCLSLIDGFSDPAGPTLVTARHEEGAGLMAEAMAKATGHVGVVLASRGPGATHLSIALHTARQDSTPLLAIIGQVPTDLRGREAFQEIDYADFCKPLAKSTVELKGADGVDEIVREALDVAQSGRPGPVVLVLPEDVDRTPCAASSDAMATARRPDAPAPPERALEAAARVLEAAEAPIIIVGSGVLRSRSTDDVIALAHAIGAGVYTGWRRFDAYPNDDSHHLGNLPFMREDLLAPLLEADVVLALGTRMGEFTSLGYRVPGEQQTLIQVDVSAESMHPESLQVLGDCGEAARRLSRRCAAALASETRHRREASIAAARERFAAATTPTPAPEQETGYVDLEAAYDDLRTLVPAHAATTSDAGIFGGWLNRFYRWTQAGTFFGPTAGGMGYAVPAAVGVKLADRSRPVLAFAGDGGFAMTMSEVQTAARLGLGGLVFLVFNNGQLGTIRAHQARHMAGRQVGVELGRVDFAKVAEGLGAEGLRAGDNTDFRDAIRYALAAPRPVVVDIAMDPDSLDAWSPRLTPVAQDTTGVAS